jgi:hypothetical protein
MGFRPSRITKPKLAVASAAALAMATGAVLAVTIGPAGASTKVPDRVSVPPMKPGPISVPPMKPGPISVPPMIHGPKIEHFQIVTTNSKALEGSSIIATGAFTAGGTIIGSIREGGTGTVVFPNGTFKITVNHVTAVRIPRRNSCLMIVHGSGNYKLADGTGKYARISGAGKLELSSMSTDARNSKGNCAAQDAYQQVINLKGKVKV